VFGAGLGDAVGLLQELLDSGGEGIEGGLRHTICWPEWGELSKVN
jgi:hypothetical protein